jgi:hypothetical protein
MTCWRRRRLSPAIIAIILSAVVVQAQQRPLLTEDPRLIPDGELLLENGLGYFDRARFPVSGLGGDLLAVLTGGLYVGMGRAEFQAFGTIYNFLWIDEGGTGRTSDWGDGTIATKFAILTESGRRPDVSFQTAVVLPNASNESGLGKDGTDFIANVLVGKTAGTGYVFGKVGLGILDDAERVGAQQDVLTWGIAGVVPLAPGFGLAAEVGGIYNATSNPTAGGEDRAETRVGARWRMWGMDWDVAATAGLTDFDHRVGVVFGTTTRFEIW